MTTPFHLPVDSESLLALLREDIDFDDITTNALVRPGLRGRGELLAKTDLVLAGRDVFAEIFSLLDPTAEFEFYANDGDVIKSGAVPIRVKAAADTLLSGERTALNLIERMSGIATLARKHVEAVKGTNAKIVDSRKSLPGLRALDTYSVHCGGINHLHDLSHAVHINPNHIRIAGGVRQALAAAAPQHGKAAWIEIEVTNLLELSEAMNAPLAERPDVIMLDNMTPSQAADAVMVVRTANPEHTIKTEASGGIKLANVREYAKAGVDWISVGALTHSSPSVELSFEISPNATAHF